MAFNKCVLFSSKEEALRVMPKGIELNSFLEAQLYELVKARNPQLKSNPQELVKLRYEIQEQGYRGSVVYYPWRETAYEILNEPEFTEVRTNRNQLKITTEEQEALKSKTIAVAGLSVGNSIAITSAMERIAGALNLADFDDLELSNLNRLRAGIPDLDLPKTYIAYKQIAETDPYIKVSTFDTGVTDANIHQFLNEDVDILVEVCDSIELKFKLRERARELGIPVIMDTNDRGMVDIERFDLEQDRPLFHGSVEGIMSDISDLNNPDKKLEIVQAIIGNELSERLKLSMPEIGQTLSSWPQLASGVMLGAAATTAVCRKILLGVGPPSGRYFVDFDEIFRSP